MMKLYRLYTTMLLLMSIGFLQNTHAQTIFSADFSNGLTPFTAVGPIDANALWTHTPDGTGSQASFWGSLDPIASPTGMTGAAIFNSDYLDTNGDAIVDGMVDASAFGTGTSVAPHRGELISPVIDCSAYPLVNLQFNQLFYNYQGTTAIGISNDGGETWEEIFLNEDIPLNEGTAGDDVQLLDISSVAGGESNVKIKFIFDGRLYFWLIDDVEVKAPPSANTAIGINAKATNYQTPISQVDSLYFGTLVSNIGASDQTNVVAKMQIIDEADAVVYTDSTTLDMLDQGVDSLVLIGDGYLPSETGIYRLDYTLTQDAADNFPGDNVSQQTTFVISENVFARSSDVTGANRPNGGGSYLFGNSYYIINAGDEALSATFAAASSDSLTDVVASMQLYQLTEPGVYNDDNITLVGYGEHTFTTENNFDLVTVDLEDINTNEIGVPLMANTEYLLMFGYDGSRIVFCGTDDVLRYDLQVASVLRSGTEWFGGFTSNATAVARMTVGSIEVDVDEVLADNKIEVMPTLARDIIRLKLDLDQTQHRVEVQIVDVMGKVLIAKNHKNIKERQFTYNVSNFAAGTYFITVSTPEGTKTEQFVVVK